MSAELELRALQGDPAEVDHLARWLGDPRVCEWLEGPSSTMARADVEDMYSAAALRKDGVLGALIVYRGTPIGFVQWYPVGSADEYQLDTADGTWGIDIFIGEPLHWGQGLGTLVMKEVLAKLWTEHGATRAVADPHVRNARAIKCCIKAGFRKIRILKGHEPYEGVPDDCWLMSARPPKP